MRASASGLNRNVAALAQAFNGVMAWRMKSQWQHGESQ